MKDCPSHGNSPWSERDREKSAGIFKKDTSVRCSCTVIHKLKKHKKKQEVTNAMSHKNIMRQRSGCVCCCQHSCSFRSDSRVKERHNHLNFMSLWGVQAPPQTQMWHLRFTEGTPSTLRSSDWVRKNLKNPKEGKKETSRRTTEEESFFLGRTDVQ